MTTRKISIGTHHCSSTLARPPIKQIANAQPEAATRAFLRPATIASGVRNNTAEDPVAFTENFAKVSKRGWATGRLSMKSLAMQNLLIRGFHALARCPVEICVYFCLANGIKRALF